MTILHILTRKGRDVTTVGPEVTVAEVVRILAVKHIGALVIADADGKILGIVSERDIVRAVADHGADALNDPIAHVMTKSIVTGSEGDNVLDAVKRMSDGRFRHLPILRDGALVGIVSMGDVIKYRLEQMEREQNALREYIATA